MDSVASAKDGIEKQMKSMVDAIAKIESPISVAIDFDKLHRSNDPEKRQIADILQGISEIKALIGKPAPKFERHKLFSSKQLDALRHLNWTEEERSGIDKKTYQELLHELRNQLQWQSDTSATKAPKEDEQV